LQEVEKHGVAILNQTEELSKRLNALLDQDNRASLANTVKQIGKTAAAWEALPAKLDPVLTSLPQTINHARESALAFKQFAENAKNTSSNLNQLITNLQGENGSIARVSKNLEQVSQNLQYETLPAMNSLILDAGGALRGINRSTENFNDRPQSLLFGPKPIPPGPGEPGFKNN
jgi:phospholipid/cholesterol/gamma-HCH transport system substrate-binding protein